MTSLFDNDPLPRSSEQLEEGAVLLHGFATAEAPVLLEEVARVAKARYAVEHRSRHGFGPPLAVHPHAAPLPLLTHPPPPQAPDVPFTALPADR